MEEFKTIFLKVLDIIDYRNDKEKHANQFIALCGQKALLNCLQELPGEQRSIVQKNANLLNEPIKFGMFIKDFVDGTTYINNLHNTFYSTLKDYIYAVLPTLSNEQKKELTNYSNLVLEQKK